jgi:integrase/recombinase XerD
LRQRHLVESFLEMMSAERGAAANTLSAYARDLEAWGAHLEGAGVDFLGASPDHVRGFMEKLAGAGMAASTQARHLSAVRQLHRFLFAEGLREDDPSSPVSSPKLQRPLPKIMSVAEVERLIAQARSDAHEASTGRGELAAIRDRHACERTGFAAHLGGAGRAVPDDYRQGQQGTADAAVIAGSRRDVGLAGGAQDGGTGAIPVAFPG